MLRVSMKKGFHLVKRLLEMHVTNLMEILTMYVMGAEKKFRDFRLGEREFEVDGRLTFIYPDSCKSDDENLIIKEKMKNELVRTVLPLLDEYR